MSGNSLAASWSATPIGRTAAPLREQVIATLRQAIIDSNAAGGNNTITFANPSGWAPDIDRITVG